MRILAVVVALLAGCSAEAIAPGESPVAATCPARSGSYKITWTQKNGTCGPIPDQIVAMSDTLAAGCTGSVTPSSNNCKTDSNITCTDADGYKLTVVGGCTWGTNGRTGFCEVQATNRFPNGSVECTSLYTASYAKL
jgi:hypothetical protein